MHDDDHEEGERDADLDDHVAPDSEVNRQIGAASSRHTKLALLQLTGHVGTP